MVGIVRTRKGCKTCYIFFPLFFFCLVDSLFEWWPDYSQRLDAGNMAGGSRPGLTMAEPSRFGTGSKQGAMPVLFSLAD